MKTPAASTHAFTKRAAALFLALLCLLPWLIPPAAGAEEQKETNRSVFTSVSDLNGKTIGVQTGSISDQAVERNVKDAVVQYYESETDEAIAVEQGKIDAAIVDEPVGRLICLSHPALALMDDCLEDDTYGIMFQKTDAGAALRDQMNEFIAACFSDGTLDDMDEKLTLRLLLAAEELTMSGLVRTKGVEYPAELSVEYSSDEKSCVLFLTYGGGQINAAEHIDALASKVLNGDIRSIDYSFEEAVNKITVRL